MTIPTDKDFGVFLHWGQNPTDAFAAVGSMTDVTTTVTSATVSYGRSSFDADFSPMTATVVLRNDTGTLDPDNAAGAHYGNLLPGSHVVIQCDDSGGTPTNLFRGYVRSRGGFRLVYDGAGNLSTLTLEAVGAFGVAAEYTWTNVAVASGDGVNPVDLIDLSLTDSGLSLAKSNVDTTSCHNHDTATPTDSNYLANVGSLLDWWRRCMGTEGGWLMDLPDGIVAAGRSYAADTTVTTVQDTLSDDGSDTRFRLDTLGRTFGDHVATRVRVADYDGGTITTEAVGDVGYLSASLDLNDTFLVGAVDATALGEWWRDQYNTVDAHPNTIAIRPLETDNELDAALTLQPPKRVTVEHTPPGLSQQSHACLVGSVHHVITPTDWMCTFGLESAERIDALSPTTWLQLQ